MCFDRHLRLKSNIVQAEEVGQLRCHVAMHHIQHIIRDEDIICDEEIRRRQQWSVEVSPSNTQVLLSMQAIPGVIAMSDSNHTGVICTLSAAQLLGAELAV